MSPGQLIPERINASFPRVSGDEPARVAELNGGGKFSPRERG